MKLDRPILFEGLWGAPKAFLIHQLQQETKRPLIIITSSDTLYQDLSFFQPVLEMPSWEALPGEEIPPSLDIMGRRLEVSLLRG